MERRQLILFGAIFAAVLLLLAVIYFAFLRQGYAMLYENMREADAAEIVAVLDKQGIEYRLDDGGHRVLVPEDEVGRARVLVAGSGVAMGGAVGFELFNETDMGLTEFAQKVNYQRALQGELARTIMGMEGISFARVHLSLPERTLFRANQSGPKGAVTLETAGGGSLDPSRVVGIQQLVSAAVTDLPANAVAVLDHRGRLLSSAPSEGDEPGVLDERSALEEYYRARAHGVAEKLLPGLPFEVRVLAVAIGNEPPAGDAVPGASSDSAADTAPSTAPATSAPSPGSRNFRLRIAVRTEMELTAEDRELLSDGITRATEINQARGDILRFETGPLGQSQLSGNSAASTASLQEAPPLSPIGASSGWNDGIAGSLLTSGWLWALFAILAVFALILLRRRSRLSPDEQQSFADLLGENLAVDEGLADGR